MRHYLLVAIPSYPLYPFLFSIMLFILHFFIFALYRTHASNLLISPDLSSPHRTSYHHTSPSFTPFHPLTSPLISFHSLSSHLISSHLFRHNSALAIPVDCINNLQSDTTIVVDPIPLGVCNHIITDKHWLIENILCLLSNATKYSTCERPLTYMYMFYAALTSCDMLLLPESYLLYSYSLPADWHPTSTSPHSHDVCVHLFSVSNYSPPVHVVHSSQNLT